MHTRSILPVVFALCVFIFQGIVDTKAQIVFDDFGDGNFTTNPTWEGDESDFIINTGGQMQSNLALEEQSFLLTQFSAESLDDKEWLFYLKQSFSGSGNNYGRVYLAFNGNDLTHINEGEANVSGYYMLFGEAGSADAVKLFYTDGLSPTLICEGPAGQISSSFEWRCKVRRDINGNWEIFADEAAGEAFTALASGAHVNADSFSNLGWVCTYTASNADNFFLDDVYFGDWIVDTEAPSILNAVINSPSAIEVTFSEAMSSDAESISNYQLTGLGNPIDASFADGINTGVILTFGSEIPANMDHTLSVTGLSDLAGNVIENIDLILSYVVLSPVDVSELIISEIMADPSPQIGLPDVEWVELHNTRDEDLDLASLIFVNSETQISLPSFVLSQNERIILCGEGNGAALDPFGSVLELSSFPALSNSGDSLTLKRLDEVVIDIVDYTDNWYQDAEKAEGGWTLERINALEPCSFFNNWKASQNPLGGTPGESNSIEDNSPDTQAPQAIQAIVVNANTIAVAFSEVLDDVLYGNFEIDGIAIISSNAALNFVSLTLGEDLQTGINYTLTVNGATDCWGNSQGVAVEFDILLGAPPQPGDLLITEIMADPTPSQGLPESEYLEIFNQSDQFIDLGKILIQESSPDVGIVLAPGEYATVVSDEAEVDFIFFERIVVVSGLSSTSLTNAGTTITLSNEDGLVLDEVIYDNSWYSDPDKSDGGWSLERINLGDPCSDRSNWIASQSLIGGTPSSQNSVWSDDPDLDAPSIRYAYLNSDIEVVVLYDEPLGVQDLSNVLVDVLPVIGINDFVIDPTNPYSLIIQLTEALEDKTLYRINISGLKDCWGNASSTQSTFVGKPEKVEPNDLIINEILSNPTNDCVDFIEIYNQSDKVISLQHMSLGNGELGMLDDIDAITVVPFLLFPQMHLALSTNSALLEECYPTSIDKLMLEMDNLPSYSNDEGEVWLLDSNLVSIDQVSYNSDWHFDLLDDTDGISLERIAFDGDSNDPNNWHSAAENVNWGTPGYYNSQSINIGVSDDQIILINEIFSPDSDGYQDALLVQYSIDEPGYLGIVTIFDSAGRPVKQIANSELLGRSGIWQWDGTREEGDRADVGAYLIYIQLFDLAGNTSLFKRTCVLATPFGG